jgi:twitching motility protein PilT
MFDKSEEKQLRQRLSDMLRWVVSQRLLPRISGGRLLVQEIMGNSLRTREAVAMGETEDVSFYDIIEQSETFGWCTFDQAIVKAFEESKISEDTAVQYSSNKGKMSRFIDDAKKRLNITTVDTSGLKLDSLSISK